MKSMKRMGVVALAVGLMALFAGEASAQAPTVTFSVNGTSVSSIGTRPAARGWAEEAATLDPVRSHPRPSDSNFPGVPR